MDRAWKHAIMIGAGAFVLLRYVLPAVAPTADAPVPAAADTPPAQYFAASGGVIEPAQAAPAAAAPAQPAPAYAYYPNCTAARAAGVAPLHRWDPGYRPQLDRDNDGVACEPYNGR